MPAVASEPFDEGDVILRSSDDVDFHVYRAVLVLASPFFKSMFSLQQRSEMQAENTLPVVPISEDSMTVDLLLRYCYPIRNPDIDDLTLLGSVLEAVMKYDLDEPTRLAREALRMFLENEPLHVFAISCQLQLEEEASMAAETWKATQSWDDTQDDFALTCAGAAYVPQMANVSAAAYFRLVLLASGHLITSFCNPPLQQEENRGENTIPESFTNGSLEDGPPSEDSYHDCAAEATPSEAGPGDSLPSEYPFAHSDADFVVQSNDEVDFKVHKLVLKLQTDLSAEGAVRSLTEDTGFLIDSLPAVKVQEDSHTICHLLRLCYPVLPGSMAPISDWSVDDFCDTFPTMQAARRYGLTAVLEACRHQLGQIVQDVIQDSQLLRLYCIAVMLGWGAEAQKVASVLAYCGPAEIICVGYHGGTPC